MIDEIRELIKKYNENHDENEKIKEEHEKKRKSFVEDFPIDKINSLKIEDFVLGDIDEKAARERGPKGRGTFIYRMEYEKRNLTLKEENEGITPKKMKPWLMSISSNNSAESRWGCASVNNEAQYANVKRQLLKVLNINNQNNYDELLDSDPLESRAICKVLATYYPDKFLPNGSDKNAKKFLDKVDEAYDENENILELNDRIIKWKNFNEETRDWDNLDISRFMYGSDYMNLKQKDEKKDKDEMKINNKFSAKGKNINALDLKMNKNIILFGPPGTGKTYNTIAYSVAICSGEDVNKVLSELKNDPENIIKKYEKMKKNGQIEFITFHQSYGYEDFIEGIKPNVDDTSQVGDIQYSVEPGIFKEFCNKADRKGNFDEIYDKLLNAIGNEADGQMQIETPNGTIFKVSENSKHNLSLFTGKEFKKNGTLTKERIYGFYKGTKETSFFKTYYNGILDYIQRKVGKIEDGTEDKNYVFIIDEINRGNISKIFGELITLIEETKRKGAKEVTSVKLPLSDDEFSVPSNVYIIGTMNTADRSIALLDTALRRRFKFIEMMPNYDVLNEIKIDDLSIKDVAKKINDRIEVLFDREHTIGHAYYLRLTNNKTKEGLADLFKNYIIPLLQEYFFDDYEKIRYILGDNGKDAKYQFIQRKEVQFKELFNENAEKNNDYGLTDDDLKVKYNINDAAFNEIESYKKI